MIGVIGSEASRLLAVNPRQRLDQKPAIVLFLLPGCRESVEINSVFDLGDDPRLQYLDRKRVEFDRYVTPFRDKSRPPSVGCLGEVGRKTVALDVLEQERRFDQRWPRAEIRQPLPQRAHHVLARGIEIAVSSSPRRREAAWIEDHPSNPRPTLRVTPYGSRRSWKMPESA